MSQTIDEHPIISEFLPQYSDDLQSEWIELYYPYRSDCDLSQYQIGDALGWRNISDTSLIFTGPFYVVLTQDMADFYNYYFAYVGFIVEPVGWQVLNNSGGDIVRLGLVGGETVDSAIYDKGFVNNRSWERFIDDAGDGHWGGSFDPSGSSPGRSNSYNPFRAEKIEITISPNPFSPDGDGFEDELLISYDIPDGDSFDITIYELSGRKVKTLSVANAVPGEISWDGKNDFGDKLPIGIYVLYARVNGDIEYETKKTIVIAR